MCTSIQPTTQKDLFLIRGDKDWHYLLVNNNLLQGLAKLLPLKIKLADYGKIIKSGKGNIPSRSVVAQMQKADFSKPSIADSQIFYLLSHDKVHTDFYTYLDVPYYLEDAFIKARDSGKEFEFTEYGDIIRSGWGHAPGAVKLEMKTKYGIETPEEEHA